MASAEISPKTLPQPVRDATLRAQLLSRQQRLRALIPVAPRPDPLRKLLQEVDSALARIDTGSFGLCDTCHDPIEDELLQADPLVRNCSGHLTEAEQRTLKRELDVAVKVQRGLLPQPTVAIDGCSMAYAYEPAGPVSGDYCDVITLERGTGLFLLGDVTGKGVGASMLMAHLHAIFRSLATVTSSVSQLVTQANQVFCQGTLPSHFATLVCGSVDRDGAVEVCNAGHCLPLHATANGVTRIESTGLPLGLTGDGEYPSKKLTLARGDTLVLYTDGLSECFSPKDEQYGITRLSSLLWERRSLPPKDLLGAILEDGKRWRCDRPPSDDLTVMVIRREA